MVNFKLFFSNSSEREICVFLVSGAIKVQFDTCGNDFLRKMYPVWIENTPKNGGFQKFLPLCYSTHGLIWQIDGMANLFLECNLGEIFIKM